jgi:hypothetical protein
MHAGAGGSASFANLTVDDFVVANADVAGVSASVVVANDASDVVSVYEGV